MFATEYFRPRSVEQTVDAGVHHVVAAMRMSSVHREGETKHIIDGINLKATPWMKRASDENKGYTYQRKNGLITSVGTSNTAETAPLSQLKRLADGQMVCPDDYFKQAKKLGINPAETILNMGGKNGPGLPTRGERSGENKKNKSKKKDKKKKDKKKDKKKKKKSASPSSSSSDSSLNEEDNAARIKRIRNRKQGNPAQGSDEEIGEENEEEKAARIQRIRNRKKGVSAKGFEGDY